MTSKQHADTIINGLRSLAEDQRTAASTTKRDQLKIAIAIAAVEQLARIATAIERK